MGDGTAGSTQNDPESPNVYFVWSPASNTTSSTRMLQEGQINLAEEEKSTLAMLGGLASRSRRGRTRDCDAGEGGPRENGWREEEGRERRSSERKKFPIIFAS